MSSPRYSQPIDPRARRTRDYPAVEIPFRGSSFEVRAGEDETDSIRGWIIVFGYRREYASPHQELEGRLDLRYPQATPITHRVEGFDAGRGGAFFAPWPFVGLSIRDVSEQPPPHEEDPSVAAVSMVPVLCDDLAPPGLRSVLRGRTALRVPPEGIWVEVPDGASDYRVLPAEILTEGKRLTITETTGEAVWAVYTIDPYEPLASGAALGASAWTLTPREPGAMLHIEHDDEGHRNVSISWRFDLGEAR